VHPRGTCAGESGRAEAALKGGALALEGIALALDIAKAARGRREDALRRS